MNDKDPIFRSLAMIEEKIQERLTVEMLAKGIHFSKYHYQRIFREAVGETVMGYVTRRKLFLAAGELAGTMDSVLAIALKYGYDSHEGFSRSFKAYFGVTPTEYRKYHAAISFPVKKEESAMTNSKNTNELIRELNRLIVQAKETVANTEKYKGADVKAAAVYAQVWEFASKRTEKMAGRLKKISEYITAMTEHPDEISVCFLVMKALENASFEASVTAFQVGLMIARAMPEHCATFLPLCDQYDSLAQNARNKSGKIVDFFNEMSLLIFQDMRKDALQKIQNAVATGQAAAKKLADSALPYGYIAKEIETLSKELAILPLEDVTVYFLEDALFHLETILFAADMDILRAPHHKPLFDGISDFKEKLNEAAELFRSLSRDMAKFFAAGESSFKNKFTEKRIYHELAAQEEILLFYLKGEIQKLGNAHLEEGQKKALEVVCDKMDRAVKMARNAADGKEGDKTAKLSYETETAKLLCEAYDELTACAKQLGMYGGAIQYLAAKIKQPLGYLPENN